MMIVVNLSDVERELMILDRILDSIHDNALLTDEDQMARREALKTVFEDRFVELLHTVSTAVVRMKDFKPAEIEEAP